MFYRALTTLSQPAVYAAGLFFKAPSHFPERLGRYSAAPEPDRDRLRVWLHGASAGEVNAVAPLVAALKQADPTLHLTLTTTSLTGRKLALEKGLADRVALAPLDLPGPLRRAFDAFAPQLVLIAETEFWPNWLEEARRRSVPMVLVNGRISDRSFPTYRKFRFLFRGPLTAFSACLVQTDLDRERLTSLGAPADRVETMGQMKYDLRAPEEARVRSFSRDLGITYDQALFTFGSLREGEDEEILAAIPRLMESSPSCKVVLAPRHFRNLGKYEQTLDRAGVPWAFRSRKVDAPWRVLVLDTMGELGLAYALSRAAFVGGTLAPVGGHNVMEPALAGVPVCFGPHLANVREAAAALTASGGAAQVASGAEAVEWMARLTDPAESKRVGALALASVEPLRGATRRTLERLRPFLATPPRPLDGTRT